MAQTKQGRSVRVVFGTTVFESITDAMEGTGLSRYHLGRFLAEAALGKEVYALGKRIYALDARLHYVEHARKITAGVNYKRRSDRPLLVGNFCTEQHGVWR